MSNEDDTIPEDVLTYLLEGNDPTDLAKLFWEALSDDAKIELINEVIAQNLIIATDDTTAIKEQLPWLPYQDTFT